MKNAPADVLPDSHNFTSCLPNPICVSGYTDFTAGVASIQQNATLYNGNASSYDWVVNTGTVHQSTDGLRLLLTQNNSTLAPIHVDAVRDNIADRCRRYQNLIYALPSLWDHRLCSRSAAFQHCAGFGLTRSQRRPSGQGSLLRPSPCRM